MATRTGGAIRSEFRPRSAAPSVKGLSPRVPNVGSVAKAHEIEALPAPQTAFLEEREVARPSGARRHPETQGARTLPPARRLESRGPAHGGSDPDRERDFVAALRLYLHSLPASCDADFDLQLLTAATVRPASVGLPACQYRSHDLYIESRVRPSQIARVGDDDAGILRIEFAPDCRLDLRVCRRGQDAALPPLVALDGCNDGLGRLLRHASILVGRRIQRNAGGGPQDAIIRSFGRRFETSDPLMPTCPRIFNVLG